MRMYRIVINGKDHSVVPAYGTPEEAQHEIALRSGGLVRVIEFIKQDPPEREDKCERYGDED